MSELKIWKSVVTSAVEDLGYGNPEHLIRWDHPGLMAGETTWSVTFPSMQTAFKFFVWLVFELESAMVDRAEELVNDLAGHAQVSLAGTEMTVAFPGVEVIDDTIPEVDED